MFASSPISIGEQEACIDTYNDVDFYIFKPNTTRTYTIQTTSDRRREEFNGSTREYDLFIEDINIDDLDCEIYDKYGKLVYYDKKAGQINRDFYLSGGQNYFIKIYNYSKEPCNYKITLS